MKQQIMITTPTFGKFSDQPKDKLLQSPYSFIRFDKKALSEEDILTKCTPDIVAIITGIEPITARVMTLCPDLKVIVKHGIGVDNINLQWAKEHKISVYNTPGANADAVADFTVGLFFALARDTINVNKQFCEGKWPRPFGCSVWGATLGVLGFGSIGKKTALRGRGLNMKVLAYDWLFDEQFATQHKIKKSDLVTILKESDFVAIHLPLTAETKDLIDEKELKKMKKSAYLINTARGGIVNEEALYKALVGKVIAGAALDVFVNEPPKDFNLIRLPNVIATPHMAGYTFEAIENMGNMAANTALKVLAGEETIGKIV